MNNTYYLETNSTNPYYNLAFEEYILKNKLSGDFFLLWQNKNTIVIGQNQNTLAEINQDFAEKNGIRVIRRSTGGGAVYHDLGNLNYSFITDSDKEDAASFSKFTKPIVQALGGLTSNVKATGRNDITINEKKVSGTAQRIYKNRVLHHGTLLFSSDSEMIRNSLNPDPDKFIGKASKSVRARVGNIKDFLKEDMDISEFWQYIKNAILKEGYESVCLSEKELIEVTRIKETKYETWEWNYGRSPSYEFTNKARFAGGSIMVGFRINKGIIEDIDFYGDFLSRKSLSPVKIALTGCKYVRGDVEHAVSQISGFSDYFGSITKEEISHLIMNLD